MKYNTNSSLLSFVLIFLSFCVFVFASQDQIITSSTSSPLVSVIVLTHQRPLFLQKSLQLISQQTYSNIEIVIIDDSPIPSLSELEQTKAGIKFHHLPERRMSIGEKRNLGASFASGEIIVHWDDDDFFRNYRVTKQIAPILSGEADMTVLEHHYYLYLPSQSFYIVKRASTWGPHFATFVYRRSLFSETNIRYPDNSMAEDYAFAERALEMGHKIKVMNNEDGTHVYVRHFNTWEINFEEYDAQVAEVPRPHFFSNEDFEDFVKIEIAPVSSKPPNHFASADIKWNRIELQPGWQQKTQPNEEHPTYPHYHNTDDSDGGLTVGQKVGIGVGVTGGVVLVFGGMIAGTYYYCKYRRLRDRQPYRALTEFPEINL